MEGNGKEDPVMLLGLIVHSQLDILILLHYGWPGLQRVH